MELSGIYLTSVSLCSTKNAAILGVGHTVLRDAGGADTQWELRRSTDGVHWTTLPLPAKLNFPNNQLNVRCDSTDDGFAVTGIPDGKIAADRVLAVADPQSAQLAIQQLPSPITTAGLIAWRAGGMTIIEGRGNVYGLSGGRWREYRLPADRGSRW